MCVVKSKPSFSISLPQKLKICANLELTKSCKIFRQQKLYRRTSTDKWKKPVERVENNKNRTTKIKKSPVGNQMHVATRKWKSHVGNRKNKENLVQAPGMPPEALFKLKTARGHEFNHSILIPIRRACPRRKDEAPSPLALKLLKLHSDGVTSQKTPPKVKAVGKVRISGGCFFFRPRNVFFQTARLVHLVFGRGMSFFSTSSFFSAPQ